MNKFETNDQMESLLRARKEQPELFAQLPATTKMSLGIYQNGKELAAKKEPTQADVARIRELKEQLTAPGITPFRRTALAYELETLEEKINANSTK